MGQVSPQEELLFRFRERWRRSQRLDHPVASFRSERGKPTMDDPSANVDGLNTLAQAGSTKT
jgi:hypothetical protein